ncbi:protein FAR1-RELATED SEQUENCE 5-like [Camellia sinensis]|uniref:protein FAR1-RELATED SEQUENCE 5-like n=1 Tax=Camellia sinensis TaxID=4442 RepID=UPI001035571B|nr:protein FAR1-RELATED SEQUENCE 5-like [Camellia sinensis]
MEDEDNNSSETGIPLGDASTRGSKVNSELVMDYSNEFVTYGIFKSRDELIQWARQVGRRNGFVIVVQKSDGGGIRATYDDWNLIVICGVHNHPATKYLEVHSYARRLSHEETSLLVDMSKSMVRPSEILVTLKQRDDANASTMKTIYNARHKYKVAKEAGRSQMQQLLGQLAMNKYIEWHRSCADTETVTNLFFAHPTSLKLLRAFPKVLPMDCIYKTNRYRLPILEIVGVTSTDMTFSVAFAYPQYEKEDNYTWALGLLRSVMDENTLPSVIVTDRELALMNAICTVFPATTNLLCRWHIGKNVLANCKKMFETKDKWEMVESSHAKLKRYLGSSQENFESNWTRIHNLLELQHSEIKSSFEKSKIVVQHDFKPAQFKELHGNVSITALEIILAEFKRASSVGIDITAYGCVV